MALDLFCHTVSFAIPAAHALSVCIGAGGCGWPKSSRVLCNTHPFFALKNNAPSSASVSEDETAFIIALFTWIGAINGDASASGNGAIFPI